MGPHSSRPPGRHAESALGGSLPRTGLVTSRFPGYSVSIFWVFRNMACSMQNTKGNGMHLCSHDTHSPGLTGALLCDSADMKSIRLGRHLQLLLDLTDSFIH